MNFQPRRIAMEQLLSTDEVASLLDVAPATVRYWRHAGTGPRAYKVGRHVRYRLAEVESWLDAQAVPAAGGAA
jgi:excisionase family DNA binding protein